MTRTVEWIEPKRRVEWLGQLGPITFDQMLREPEPNGNGEKPLEKKVEEEEKEIQQIERGLSTTEKVVIASLFLQVLTFAWGVFQFRARQRREAA